jgi:hypothetical protein
MTHGQHDNSNSKKKTKSTYYVQEGNLKSFKWVYNYNRQFKRKAPLTERILIGYSASVSLPRTTCRFLHF